MHTVHTVCISQLHRAHALQHPSPGLTTHRSAAGAACDAGPVCRRAVDSAAPSPPGPRPRTHRCWHGGRRPPHAPQLCHRGLTRLAARNPTTRFLTADALLLLSSGALRGASADVLEFRLAIPKDAAYTRDAPAGFYCQLSSGTVNKARRALAATLGFDNCGVTCPVTVVGRDCKWRPALRNTPNRTGVFVLRSVPRRPAPHAPA